MKSTRRTFLQIAGATVATPVFSRAATAQTTYPTRPITMIVPFPAGGTTDVVGRVVAERMSKYLARPIIVENVGGAEGSIGLGRVAHARPDGYMIGLGGSSTHVFDAAFYSRPYDVLNDFAAIASLAATPGVLFARKPLPANNLSELIAWLKANPNRASAGIYSGTSHLVTALFQKETGAQFTLVPYRGEAPATQDLAASQIDLLFASPAHLPLMRAGAIKAYAVTSATRLVLAPDLPTFAEMGLPTLSFSVWYGLFAPRGTPKDIIGTLNAAVVDALADSAAQSQFIQVGLNIFPRERQTAEALSAMQRNDAAKWWPLIKEFGIKANPAPPPPPAPPHP
jgi:tripartite-type tricarboxylate transporter receptor subunit TctC